MPNGCDVGILILMMMMMIMMMMMMMMMMNLRLANHYDMVPSPYVILAFSI